MNNARVFRKGGGAGMSSGAGGAQGHRTRRHLRRARSAGRRAQGDQGGGDGAGRPRTGGGGARQVSTRRRHFSYVASFAEVEVDVETGKYYITDFLAYGDVGTVLHPHSLGGQMLGRSTLGIAHAIGPEVGVRPEYGVAVAKRFYQNKPPTILDVPVDMQWAALNIPDPETPVGARGVGEPPVGGGCACDFERAVRCAGRRDLPSRAGERGYDSDVVRSGTPDAASVDGASI